MFVVTISLSFAFNLEIAKLPYGGMQFAFQINSGNGSASKFP